MSHPQPSQHHGAFAEGEPRPERYTGEDQVGTFAHGPGPPRATCSWACRACVGAGPPGAWERKLCRVHSITVAANDGPR